ncbi:uncharacterized protein [Ptychodera flava]|uniref:uncharacterized protein n=1 Tax=Ptychodera flava TaxID=63121 RepID=UPI00396A5315
MAVAVHTFRLLSKIFLFTALQHYYGVSVVNAGYSNAYGPLTCLCADRNFYTFDSSVVVRQFGCSLFDYCEKCTDNEHQPCVSCPPNRYGPKCEKECDCGYQPCDDGIYGDGECLCSTEDLREGGRCEQLVSSQRKLKEDEYFPAPQVSVDSSKILLSWQLLWFQSNPIVRYEVQYKFADRVSSRYGKWTQHQSTSSANQTYEIFQYQPTETDGYYKFRINGVHRSDYVRKGVATSAVKVPGTPEAPEAVQIDSIEGNTVTIKWSDPPEDFVHGNEITGYIVQYQLYGFLSSWVTVADAKFEENAVTIHDLQPLKIYRFRVAARNKLGIGRWSSEQTMMLPKLEDLRECYTREDGSDYRGRISKSKSGNTCLSWSTSRWTIPFFAYGRPSYSWNHTYCRNPESMWGSARCWTGRYFPEDCNIGEPQEHCPKVCAPGMVMSDKELCVVDDQTELYNKVPLLNGEICTCALQIKDETESAKYIEPRSFVGWTYACAHAVGNDERTLIDNIYNMDADVCYKECLKSGCSAYTYSTNGYNEYGNETDIRLCTLFTDMYTPVVVEKHANWTSYLEQEVPDDTDFILTWGCWAASDPRNPGDKWRNLGLENFMVFRNPAFKNYSVNIYMTEGPTNGLKISLMINGTLNTTTPMIFFVKPGNQQFYVINRNVGFVTALKIVGQIGNQITLETVEVQLDNIITEFSCQWCGDSDFYKMDRIKECRAKGTLGGHTLPNTRVIMPTTTTILSEYHGFACTSMAYSTAYNEAFFGWCPLPPKLVSIGVPAKDRRPPFLLEVGESEDIYRRRKRDTEEKDGTYLIIEDKTFTWQEAVDACLQMGKMIVKVFDDDILQGVQNAISKQGFTGEDFWINGYNEGIGATLWRTHDKHALSVKDELWAEGQPDLSGKCLQVRYRDDVQGYKLDGTLCNIRKRAICERQSAARSSDCKANNDIFANTECVAMLNFQVNSLRNENLEDMSVIVESTKLSISFRGERHIRYLALEAISDPWTRISVSNTSIPRSVLIDTIDTHTTSKLQISIESERLRKLIEELLNGKFVTGRYGFMLRPLKDQQQAGFDDIIVWKQSSLRPTLKLQIKTIYC